MFVQHPLYSNVGNNASMQAIKDVIAWCNIRLSLMIVYLFVRSWLSGLDAVNKYVFNSILHLKATVCKH